MKVKVDLVVIWGPEVVARSGVLDDGEQTIEENKPFYSRRDSEFYDLVSMDHLKRNRNRPRRPLVFIDGNGRKSCDPVVEVQLDAEARNKLNYLSQASFWKGFRGYKLPWWQILLAMVGGVGFLQFFKYVLAAFGKVVPF